MNIPDNITKQNLIDACEKIITEGIPSNGHSSTYDVFYEGKLLPPKLVVSYANYFANGSELERNDFEGGIGTKCFKILENNGFIILEKNGFYSELIEFINQAKTDNLKTLHFKKEYQGLDVKVSFGQGNTARIPWISFLGDKQKTSNGIYPVYLLYKSINKLVLAYGVSETEKPFLTWNFSEPKEKIKQYFTKLRLDNPERYGESYLFKIYDLNNLPLADIIDYDLKSIIYEYKQVLEGNESKSNQIIFEIQRPKVEQPKIEQPKTKQTIPFFSVKKTKFDINASGLIFSEFIISRFVASLITKPFVILSGLSGSGKTKLAQAFSNWICKNTKQYCIVPVGADWTNREPLLGYANALNKDEYIKSDNGVLDLLIRAGEYLDEPHFLILDEMNLSHVERYFADFLSVMESKEKISLYSGSQRKSSDDSIIPSTIGLSENLFIIGTVNIDETTYMFSPKVLDRANVIEFRVNSSEINSFLKNPKSVDLKLLESKGADMAKSFLEMSQNQTFGNDDMEVINKTLVGFFDELKKLGAEFGYRSANEIVRLINQLGVIDSGMTINTKIDIAIMQKLLPKLHGSRRKLTPVLLKLGEFCLESGKVEKIENDVFGVEEFDCFQAFVKYPVSLEKLIRMYKGAVENGFASYAEA